MLHVHYDCEIYETKKCLELMYKSYSLPFGCLDKIMTACQLLERAGIIRLQSHDQTMLLDRAGITRLQSHDLTMLLESTGITRLQSHDQTCYLREQD